jgi:hypothetical protein
MQVSGYNDKIANILDVLLHRLRNPTFSPARFDVVKEKVKVSSIISS